MPEITTEQVTQQSDTDPELDRKNLARWVADRWDEAESAATQEADYRLWDEWVTAYWGDTPTDTTPSYRQTILTTEMRDLILHEAQEITDTKPKVHITGNGLTPEILKQAKDLLNGQWINANVRGALLEAVVWANILPAGWIGVYWDGMLADGLGDIVVVAEDPRQVLPAPQARNDIVWPYVIKYDWIDTFSIRQRWPDTSANIKEESPPATAGTKQPKTKSSPYLGPMFSSPSSRDKSTPSISQARVLSIWVRDPGTEVKLHEIRDPATNEVTAIRPYHVMKYPRGRFITTCGDVVLDDRPWRISSFPLFRIVPQPTIGGFFQSPKVRDLLPIQRATDKSWEQNIQNAERCNEGVWFTTGETGVDPNNFTPMPGMVVEGEAGSTLDMKAPQPFPESMLSMPERLASIMRRKMGQTDARMGAVGGANIGQGLLETEISQAETPTRMAASFLYQSCRRIAQCMLETMAYMYRTRRNVAWLDSGTPQSVDWAPIEESQASSLISHLDPSSFVPRSETLEKGLVLKLASLGLVGPEYVLRHIQIPDIDEANKERNSQLFQIWRLMQQKGRKASSPIRK